MKSHHLALKLVAIACGALAACSKDGGGKAGAGATVVVGAKNFTESDILGEIAAQTLESSGCNVERKFDLGGSLVCDSAIRSGGIDVYPEYSGTALTAILKRPISLDPAAVEATVRSGYAAAKLQWGPPLGFNNTFAMIVRKSDAAARGLRTISELQKVQSTFRPGFGYEFVERPDGWKGLQAKFALHFQRDPATMDLGLTYKALSGNAVDLIAGNSTDGLIDSLGLVALIDDRHYFPPYEAAFVTRDDLAMKCGAGATKLASLRGSLDEQSMRRLNYEVDGKKRPIREVVAEWLRSRH